MRRLQLFEFNDQPWLPELVRETITEILSNGIRWGRYFDAVVPVFHDFLQEAGSESILDLCSGAGGPTSILLDSMSRAGMALPQVLMTDLFPNRAALARVAARYPDHVSFAAEPVDATAVPAELHRPVRTYINCLHHFPPHVVQRVLEDCVRARAAIFVVESFPRDVFRGARLAPSLLASMLINPWVAPQRRLAKAALTYGAPGLLLAMGALDYAVSVCRVYTPEELRGMATAVDGAGYRWVHGLAPFPFGGRAQYFYGVPSGG